MWPQPAQFGTSGYFILRFLVHLTTRQGSGHQ